jgi:hypothetical protein
MRLKFTLARSGQDLVDLAATRPSPSVNWRQRWIVATRSGPTDAPQARTRDPPG